MKRVTAFIKPHKLPDVSLALHNIDGLTGATIVHAGGFGRSRASDSRSPAGEVPMEFVPRVRLEIVCLDRLAEQVVLTIEEVAYTGLRGDGKIYVSPVENAVRISTSERGEAAV